ncbi:MAG: hypothetical protein WC505_08040 [Patescibacteria group bacterium]
METCRSRPYRKGQSSGTQDFRAIKKTGMSWWERKAKMQNDRLAWMLIVATLLTCLAIVVSGYIQSDAANTRKMDAILKTLDNGQSDLSQRVSALEAQHIPPAKPLTLPTQIRLEQITPERIE